MEKLIEKLEQLKPGDLILHTLPGIPATDCKWQQLYRLYFPITAGIYDSHKVYNHKDSSRVLIEPELVKQGEGYMSLLYQLSDNDEKPAVFNNERINILEERKEHDKNYKFCFEIKFGHPGEIVSGEEVYQSLENLGLKNHESFLDLLKNMSEINKKFPDYDFSSVFKSY